MTANDVCGTTVLDVLEPAILRQLRAAGQKVGKVTEDRDRLIREAFAAGAGVREIARAVGLSHAGVSKILARNPNTQ